MQKITPCLWFADNAEDAMDFYTSVFKNSRVVDVARYPEGGPGPAGKVMIATFEIEGQQFQVLNGGTEFQFSVAISLSVSCETQEEVDYLWDRLTADGGEPGQCAWLKDKFGVSWQIVPTALPRLMSDPDPAKSQAVMQAMLKMSKIDIAGLQRVYAQA